MSLKHIPCRWAKRSNKKSDLKDILLKPVDSLTPGEISEAGKTAVIVDMMGMVRSTSIPDTYEKLAEQFASRLPKGYFRTDIVADSYQSARLSKNGRYHEETPGKIIIPSIFARVHPDFKTIVLKNPENKARLVELIFQFIKSNSLECFQLLQTRVIVLSSEDECVKLELNDQNDVSLQPYPEFLSNHDEGDTKVILHANMILNEDPDAVVTIRSPSGDTDILVIMVGLLHDGHGDRIIFDDFHGDSRKVYTLGNILFLLDDEIINSLIGFHAFTGNDFVSSFFRKGKNTCFKLLQKHKCFRNAFSQLGSNWELSEETLDSLESFVVRLYGVTKAPNVNAARHKIFSTKFENEEKCVDMSLLPPYQSVLRLHCESTNFVAAVWKRSTESQPSIPDPVHFGWNSYRTITWMVDVFPDDIESILVDERYVPDANNDALCESEDEDVVS